MSLTQPWEILESVQLPIDPPTSARVSAAHKVWLKLNESQFVSTGRQVHLLIVTQGVVRIGGLSTPIQELASGAAAVIVPNEDFVVIGRAVGRSSLYWLTFKLPWQRQSLDDGRIVIGKNPRLEIDHSPQAEWHRLVRNRAANVQVEAACFNVGAVLPARKGQRLLLPLKAITASEYPDNPQFTELLNPDACYVRFISEKTWLTPVDSHSPASVIVINC